MAHRKKPVPAPAAPEAAGFDLATLDGLDKRQEDGIEVPILHPGTGALLLTIRVAGPDSKRAQKARQWAAEETWKAFAAGKAPTEDETYLVGSGQLARTVISWKFAPGMNLDGKTGFSIERATDAFQRFTFMRRIIDEVAANRARFMPASPSA